MLDFTQDNFDEGPSSQATKQTAASDQALLDAYSNAVIGVTERVGPAVVRVETGSIAPGARGRGGLGSGVVVSPGGLFSANNDLGGSSEQSRLEDTGEHVTRTDMFVAVHATRHVLSSAAGRR